MNTSPLKALFWKECRENARWAVLSALALTLSLAYAVYHEAAANTAASPDPANGLRLGYVWENATLVFTLGAPLVGLLLGLLQILPELRRDQWAFLVHRPASRTTLFFGKALPGVCLYLAATTLPLLALAAWDGLPGRSAAPFDWRFTLGGWAAILAGLPLYFAGLTTALRPARWYGSRALPIFAALLAPLGIGAMTEFWQAALVCLPLTAALAAAAWGSFLTSGQYAGLPRTARLGLGLSLLAGIAALVVGAVTLSATVYLSLFPQPRAPFSMTQYTVDTDGQVLRTAYADNDVRYSDVRGRPLSASAASKREDSGIQTLNFVPVINPSARDPHLGHGYNSPERYVAPLQTFLYHSEDTAWYYPYAQGQAVGYSLRTRRAVGYLGPRGFADTPEGAGRFPEPLLGSEHISNQVSLLHFAHSVLWFNTGRSEIKPLWPPSGTARIDGLCHVTQPGPGETSEDTVVVAADGRFHLFTEGNLVLTTPYATPYAADAARYPVVQVGTAPLTPGMMPPPARFFFWYSMNGFGAQSWTDSELVALSTSGRVVEAVTLPALAQPPRSSMPALLGALPPPAGDVYGLGIALRDRWLGDTRQKENWNPLAHETGLPAVLVLSALAGLLSALTAWLISRRLGDGRRGQLAWALGAFWLGLYGVLLLLALRAWPARVPCPDCRRQRAVDNAACEHCGAPFARPRRDGTEIFDAGDREAAAR